MAMLLTLKLFVYILVGGFALQVSADDPTGFINIDCGLPNGTSYTAPETGLSYISDEWFIDSGRSRFVALEYQNKYPRQSQTLRSFPEGDRNCYMVGVTRGTKYLIRASFMYGNYDEQLSPPAFDLHIGAELWDSVNFPTLDGVDKEIIHVARQSHVHVCLVKTGLGMPFISTLEFRPLDNDLTYDLSNNDTSLLKIQRIDAGSTKPHRYSDDVYDRTWASLERDDWQTLNTSSNITTSESPYQIPAAVLQTAAAPKNLDYLDISLKIPADVPDNTSQCAVYMHFCEIQELQPNQTREFNIFHNGDLFYGPSSLGFLSPTTIYSTIGVIGGVHMFRISKTKNSTLPPVINAWELYSVKTFSQSETDQKDASAMRTIKSTYRVRRNWQGDPCLPKVYLWEGVDCSYNNDKQRVPRVISLNLSSSGLSGAIPSSIANLLALRTLDLSNNNLRGSIPDFLSQLPNLKFINLENNDLTGSVPVKLIEKWKDGLLSLSVCGNPSMTSIDSCKMKHKHKRSYVIPVVASGIGTFVVLSTMAIIWWALTRKRQRDVKSIFQTNGSPESTKRKFRYREIVKITNSFEKVIGEGGFGKVYYGQINNTPVAVKMLSVASVQGYDQFQAEVNLLMRVHHKNLTSLVGYCNDRNKIALIYEYLANGNLQQHLSGKSNTLKWEDRLLIAVDAAQGLEYLHFGCKPPIIHRDVKTTNVLLNENFQAKISDFGLSRIIPDHESHVSTVVAGTHGYIDPEYYMSHRINEKSDVYSFGVVLLEIITGRSPAIPKSSEVIHVSQWVKPMIEEGRIESIVDPRFDRNFDVNSVWKAVEIAIKCVSQNSIERPTMSQVVGELKECLEMEAKRTKDALDGTELRETLMSICSADISTPSAR